jgi:succinoglycan biosynthesis transport protein ExoP
VTETTILPGAHRSGIPTDQLVSSRTFQRLIQASKRSFDVVVIDTPPIAPVVDGQYIASLADVIVFVVRWATTSQTDVREALSRLSRATRPGVPTLVVLNQQDKSEQAYRGKYGEYYVQPA